MPKKGFQKFMQKQKEAIELHKWLESEKAGKDLGDKAVNDWVRKYAASFRNDYVEGDLKAILRGLMELEVRAGTSKEIVDVINVIREKVEEIEELYG